MAVTISVLAIVVFISSVVAAGVGILAIQNKTDDMAWPVFIFMFGVSLWTFLLGTSLVQPTPSSAIFWYKVQYFGVVTVPIAYLITSLKYTGYTEYLTKQTYIGLAGTATVLMTVVWTNSLHSMYWTDLTVVSVDNSFAVTQTNGPLGVIGFIVIYSFLITGFLLFGKKAFGTDPIYRTQAVFVFIGSSVPMFAHLALLTGALPSSLFSLTGPAFVVTGLMFATALFQFEAIDIQTIARHHLVDGLTDGVVVMGPDGTVKYYNDIADQVLDRIEVSNSIDELLPPDVAPDGGELTVWMNSEEKWFQTRTSKLTGHHGHDLGCVVYLSDITDVVQRDQRISVLNRILRHNVRNELNAASGFLDIIEDDVSEDSQEFIGMAQDTASSVIDISRKARYVEETLEKAGSEVHISVSDAVTDVIEKLEGEYTDAEITYTGVESEDSDPLDEITVIDSDLFKLAIEELIENAIQHNNLDDVTVVISISITDETVHIDVSDNGPGLPKREIEVLTSRSETELEHGSGIGLWIVKWTTTLSNGTLKFSENDPRGTVVSLEFPVSKDTADTID